MSTLVTPHYRSLGALENEATGEIIVHYRLDHPDILDPATFVESCRSKWPSRVHVNFVDKSATLRIACPVREQTACVNQFNRSRVTSIEVELPGFEYEADVVVLPQLTQQQRKEYIFVDDDVLNRAGMGRVGDQHRRVGVENQAPQPQSQSQAQVNKKAQPQPQPETPIKSEEEQQIIFVDLYSDNDEAVTAFEQQRSNQVQQSQQRQPQRPCPTLTEQAVKRMVDARAAATNVKATPNAKRKKTS